MRFFTWKITSFCRTSSPDQTDTFRGFTHRSHCGFSILQSRPPAALRVESKQFFKLNYDGGKWSTSHQRCVCGLHWVHVVYLWHVCTLDWLIDWLIYVFLFVCLFDCWYLIMIQSCVLCCSMLGVFHVSVPIYTRSYTKEFNWAQWHRLNQWRSKGDGQGGPPRAAAWTWRQTWDW